MTLAQDLPIEPVAPSRTRRFGAARERSPRRDVAKREGALAGLPSPFQNPCARSRVPSDAPRPPAAANSSRDDEPIEPIHQAPVPGNQAAGILDAGPPLQRGFEEIAALRRSPRRRAPAPSSAPMRRRRHGATTRPAAAAAENAPTSSAGPGLAGRDARPELGAADEAAAEIGHDVGAPDDREQPQRSPPGPAVGLARNSRPAPASPRRRRATPAAAMKREPGPGPPASPAAAAPDQPATAIERRGADRCAQRRGDDQSQPRAERAQAAPLAADQRLPFPGEPIAAISQNASEPVAAEPGRAERRDHEHDRRPDARRQVGHPRARDSPSLGSTCAGSAMAAPHDADLTIAAAGAEPRPP